MPNLVTKEFNEMCTRAGVQCTITTQEMNGDWFRRYELSNLGLNTVTFSYKGKDHVLVPKAILVLLAEHDPKIVAHPVWYERVM